MLKGLRQPWHRQADHSHRLHPAVLASPKALRTALSGTRRQGGEQSLPFRQTIALSSKTPDTSQVTHYWAMPLLFPRGRSRLVPVAWEGVQG